ncbi:MAG: type II secretion system protein N, partial [Thiobacillus sp.]|nr:type II secretion system protein N [Thiobacillus sp.]
GLACRLDSLGGSALALAGRTVRQPGRPFTFEGTARPAAAHRQELAPLLRILGREVTPDTYRLKVEAKVGAS